MPVLVAHNRNGLIEKKIRGSISITFADNREDIAIGEVQQFIFPRSAIKYFQVLPLLKSGAQNRYGFSQDEIAVMCASHNSESIHLETVRSILKKAGLESDDLRCGPHLPMLEESKKELWIEGVEPTDLHNNCSGKHSGFLALAKMRNQDLHSYLSNVHPVQKEIREALSEFSGIGENDFVLGVDGCSAPNFGLPLSGLSRAFCNLNLITAPAEWRDAVKDMIAAITTNPYLVAGKDRFCTMLMESLGDRVIGKVGAAGVYGMSLYNEGIGIAVKIEDGSGADAYMVCYEILRSSGLFSDKDLHPLGRFKNAPIKNCNDVVVGHQSANTDILSEQWAI